MATILPFARTPSADPMSSDSTQAITSGPCDLREGEPWEDLMLRAQDGDRAAYHALLQGVAPYLRSITRRYLGRGEDAEDAVQDILLIVHGIRHTYERGRPFKPWLSTIASRRCIDLLRRRTHRMQHEIETQEDFVEPTQATHGPDEATARLHAAQAVHEAVAALPERQREAIQLLRLKELSLNEAAEQSEQSVGALKVACHRALKSLQRALGKEREHHE